MTLSRVVELDPYTFQLSVIERWTEKRWFRTVEHERQAVYTIAIRIGRFHDGQHYILRQDPRHFRLFELFAKWRLERKLDAYVGIDPPAHVLPPAPVLPRR